MNRILLPVDGSEECLKAYEMAKQIAEKFNSEIVVLLVVEPSFMDMYFARKDYQPVERNLEMLKDELLENAKKPFEGTQLNVKYLSTVGDPASAILDAAESENCDWIVIATHGLGVAKRFLIGSVTNKVVHHASVPVLVVR